ncbi:hypothetical protein VaNZ11_016737, partial [Volvox africanus]
PPPPPPPPPPTGESPPLYPSMPPPPLAPASPRQQLVFNTPLVLPLQPPDNTVADPVARIIVVGISATEVPAGTYLCSYAPASIPADGLDFLSITGLGSLLWYSLPRGYVASIRELIDPGNTYLLEISNAAETVLQQYCNPSTYTLAGTAVVPLHGGNLVSQYVGGLATSWGAMIYCHVVHGGALGTNLAVEALLLPTNAIAPLLSNTTFFGPEKPQALSIWLDGTGIFSWSSITNPECCNGDAETGAAGFRCPVLGTVSPVVFADTGETGSVPLYTPCDSTWSLRRSFTCEVPAPVATVPADGDPRMQLLLFAAQVPFWTAAQRCSVLGSRMLSLPEDMRVWGDAAAAAWPSDTGAEVWARAGGVSCSVAVLVLGAGGGPVNGAGMRACDEEKPFVCVQDTPTASPPHFPNMPTAPLPPQYMTPLPPTQPQVPAYPPIYPAAIPALPHTPPDTPVPALPAPPETPVPALPAPPDAPVAKEPLSLPPKPHVPSPPQSPQPLRPRPPRPPKPPASHPSPPPPLPEIPTPPPPKEPPLDSAAAALLRIAVRFSTGTGSSCDLSSWADILTNSHDTTNITTNTTNITTNITTNTTNITTNTTNITTNTTNITTNITTNTTNITTNTTNITTNTTNITTNITTNTTNITTNTTNITTNTTNITTNITTSINASTGVGFNPCSWTPRVACADGVQVSFLNLTGCWGEGNATAVGGMTFPAEDLRLLPALNALLLADTGVTGPPPDAVTALTRLRILDLSYDRAAVAEMSGRAAAGGLVGPLPPSWSAMTALSVLNLSGGVLNGTLPSQFNTLSSLVDLDLSAPKTEGAEGRPLQQAFTSAALTGSLPSSWSSLSSLRRLVVSGHGFLSGSLPPSWSTLTGLNQLDVSSNNLTGSLPASWSALSQMRSLELSRNQFKGPLPPQWSLLTSLAALSVADNPAVSGTLPPEYSSWAGLRELNIAGCKLTGVLPLSYNSLTVLSLLRLSDNQLSGPLPAAYSSLTALRRVELGANRLLQQLPLEWSALVQLRVLNLSSNNLSNSLPYTWSSLVHLEVLDVSYNHLTGGLPPPWSALTSLNLLDVSGGNTLAGSLPPSWSALTRLTSVDAARNALDGTLPPTWSVLASLERLDLASNALSGPLPPSYSALAALTSLDLSDNQLSGNVPGGWLRGRGGMPVLQELFLGSNRLQDGLPNVIVPPEEVDNGNGATGAGISGGGFGGGGSIMPLRFLDVSNNPLGPAELPAAAQPYMSYLASLDLTGCGLTGTLAPSWSQLSALTALHLGRNDLTGTLPPQWSALGGSSSSSSGRGGSTAVKLAKQVQTGDANADPNAIPDPTTVPEDGEGGKGTGGQILAEAEVVAQALSVSGPGLAVLQLYDNKLTGSLPAAWSALVSLTQLSLSGNRFQGPIPPSWAFGMTALNTLTVGGNASGVCGSNPGGVLWPKNQTDLPPLAPCSPAVPYPPPPPPPSPSPRALRPSPPLPQPRPLAQRPPASLPTPPLPLAAPPLSPPLVSPATSPPLPSPSPSPPQGVGVSPANPPPAVAPQLPGAAPGEQVVPGVDRSTSSSSFRPWWIAVIVASILSALLLLLLIVAALRLWRRRRRQRSQSYALGPGEIPPSSPPQSPPGVAGAVASSYTISPPPPPISSRVSRVPSTSPLAAAPPEATPSGLNRPSMYAQYHNPVFAGHEQAGGVANWQDVMSAFYLVEQEGYDPTSPATPPPPLQPAPSSPVPPPQHLQPVEISTPPAVLAAPASPQHLPRRQGSAPSPEAVGGAVRAGGAPRSMTARMAPGGPSASSKIPPATRTQSLPAPHRPART